MRNKILVALTIILIVVTSVATVHTWNKHKVVIKQQLVAAADNYNADKQAQIKQAADLKQAQADNVEFCTFIRDQLVAAKVVKVAVPAKCTALLDNQNCQVVSTKPIVGDCSEFTH